MKDLLLAKTEEIDKLKDRIAVLNNQLVDMQIYTEAIIDTINDPILILDNDLKVKNASKGFYVKFKTLEADIEGHYIYDLKCCNWKNSTLVQKLSQILSLKNSFSDYEISCEIAEFGERTFLMNAKFLENLNQQSLIIITINDITDIYLSKKQLSENKKLLEERIKLAVESADMGTWEMDPLTGKIIWDKRCQELFGLNNSIVNYDEFLNALHPADRLKTKEVISKVTQGSTDGKYNTEYRTKYENEHEMRWLKATGRAYFNKDGKAIRFAGTVLDNTRQKLNEELLQESEERFRMASDAAKAMIWLCGTDKLSNYFNKSWLQFTGKTMEQEVGNGWCDGVYPEDLNTCMEIFTNKFNAREEFCFEYRLRRYDGQYRWISDSGAPRFSPDGIFEGYIGTCIDIHDQKMTHGELEKLVADRTQLLSDAISNLETSNNNLEEFAYVASHDLQEPLRKIQTFASRLADKKMEYLSEETKLYLSKISKASVRMSILIADLLNYSRLQKTDLPLVGINLNQVIVNVLTDFELIIQEKKATVNLHQLTEIKAVPMRMNQLFHNLISNALKFTRPHIPPVLTIYSEHLPDELRSKYPNLKKDERYTMITFKDNGIGFNEEFADKIFNIFQRLNSANEYEGTGIGLAICRKIVINHHGVIFAESKENEGTLFRIILPIK